MGYSGRGAGIWAVPRGNPHLCPGEEGRGLPQGEWGFPGDRHVEKTPGRTSLDATNSTALPAGGVQWGGTGKQVAAPTLDRKVEFHPLVS